MPSYYSLTVGREYLRNFGPLTATTDPEVGGLITADITRCESDAYYEIQSRLAPYYDTSTWTGSGIPEIVKTIANLLGSSYAWIMKFNASGLGDSQSAVAMREVANNLMDDLVVGRKDIIHDGSIQSRVLKGLRGAVSRQ